MQRFIAILLVCNGLLWAEAADTIAWSQSYGKTPQQVNINEPMTAKPSTGVQSGGGSDSWGGPGGGAGGAEAVPNEELLTFVSTRLIDVDTCVDGYRYMPYTGEIKKIYVCWENSGTEDSTAFDIMRIDDSTALSILDSSSKLIIPSGLDVGCKTFEISNGAEIVEDRPLRMDCTAVALGCPRKFTVSLLLEKGKRKQ